MHIYNLVQRRKIRRKLDKFQEPISQELLGQFLSNLVYILYNYTKTLKYVSLVEIGSIGFELWAVKSAT